MTVFGSFAALFLKKAASHNRIGSIIVDTNLYLGGILYVFSAIINIVLLKYFPYSFILPATSLTYVWTMIIAKLYLDETITLKKVTGLILISTGVILLSFN